jgi:hypothetical protein
VCLLYGSLVLVAVLAATVQADDVRHNMYRTTIKEHAVGGLSGHWLTLDPAWGIPRRAWAGITTAQIDSAARTRLSQRAAESAARCLKDVDPSLPDDEVAARTRHLQHFEPELFDRVVVELVSRETGDVRALWLTDTDLDHDLADEKPLADGHPENAVASLAFVAGQTVEITVAGTEKLSTVTLTRVSSVPDAAGSPKPSESPESIPETLPADADGQLALIRKTFAELVALDSPATRKQYLQQIVQHATTVIRAIDNADQAVSGRNDVQHLLVESLYRKGRALGYQELPDVVAVRPVKNPEQLDEQFEANYRRLQQLVDVTLPEYILLSIRRERRRGHYGKALDLVGKYRDTRPNPVWQHKKRRDLLAEMGADLHADQASLDLWLHGQKPAKPVPVAFRVGETAGQGQAATVVLNGFVEEPWQLPSTAFLRQADDAAEAVIWLNSSSDYRLTVTDSDGVERTKIILVTPLE